MQAISGRGVALIKACEGFSAQAYRCPAGKMTIGYGHVIGESQGFPDGVNEKEAEQLLLKDIHATEQAVCRLAKVSLQQNQFDALVSFTYNIGVGAFEGSTLLRRLNTGDPQVAEEFPKWVYIHGQRSDGLARRRSMEMALFCQ